MKKIVRLIGFSFVLMMLYNCKQEVYLSDEEQEYIENHITDNSGFYLLNEGLMGANLATIDYMNFSTGIYRRNIYPSANPNIVKELGDVGNDIKIYGSKLYAVINVSNLIEVMDAKTAKHLGTIPLENGRNITFANGKGYASSYAGIISTDPKAPLGKVVEIDTISLSIIREQTVGYQPEELEVVGNKLYVANSGGYRLPNYDNTVSVVDLNSFEEIKKIEVGVNLNHLKKDSQGDLYISSRGDYKSIAPNFYVLDSKTEKVKKIFNIDVANFTIDEDKLYYISKSSYGIINTKTEEVMNDNFLKSNNIKTPYGIGIHPKTKEIFITDARDYVSDGFVYCFDNEGNFKWNKIAGNIPAHFAFINQPK